MTTNHLKRIYENNEKIAELNKQIKAYEAENQKFLDAAMVAGITEQEEYRLITKTTARRDPIPAMVREKIGDEKALEIATYTIKSLQKLMGEDDITAICRVNESIKRVVEKVE